MKVRCAECRSFFRQILAKQTLCPSCDLGDVGEPMRTCVCGASYTANGKRGATKVCPRCRRRA